MRKCKFARAFIAALLIAALLCGSALAASLDAKVFSSSMTVYKSTSGGKLGRLRRGTAFTVKGISGEWAKISYRGRTGYAKLKNIIFDKYVEAVSTQETPIRFITKGTYKRGVYYTGTLSKGVPLRVVGVNGNYLLFLNEQENAMGYVSKSAVKKAN